MVSVWPLWEINMQVDNLALDIWAYYTGSPALSIDFRLVLLPTPTMNKENGIIQTCPLSQLKITNFVLHLFMDLQFATITITGHRSALSSLMTFRWLNISRIPDRNILVISFSVGSFTIYPFQPKNICLLPNMNVKLFGTLALTKRNSEVLTLYLQMFWTR